MASKTLQYLKDTNRTFDNILDTMFTKDSHGVVADGQAYGVYEGAFEINFGTTGHQARSTTITTTNNGLIATVATVPANCTVLDAAIVTSEAFDSDDEKGMDLVITSTSPAAADTAISGDVVQLITAAEMKNSSTGALGKGQGLVGNPNFIAGGAGTHLCLINTDGSNTGDAIQSGKAVVYIKYAGGSAPVANTTV